MATRGFVTKAKPWLEKFSLPEKWRGGRIERYVKFWENVATDYKEATLEIIEGCRTRPLKAFAYATLGSGLVYLNKTRPSELDFKESCVKFHHDLTLVGDSTRNRKSQQYLDKVNTAVNSGTLKVTSLGIATVIWEDNFDAQVGLTQAQCKYTQPTYTEIWQHRIIDVGLLGDWTLLTKLKKDYDVNCDEWDEQGRAKSPNEQLRPLF